MVMWGVIVCIAAIAALQVNAQPFAFIENAQGPVGSRIVSGWEAEEGQIPWQLSLRMVADGGGVSSCGASVIHPEWGMTAAHCTANRVTFVLRAGAVSLTRPELIFETTEYYNHPLFIDALSTVVQPHDIALLKLGRSLTFTDRVQPVRLQPSSEMNRNYEDVRLLASGWGRTWTLGASPENLQWVYLRGDTNEYCREAFGGSSIIVESTICASYYNVTSQSTCQGDSGGPLVELADDGQYTMVGVTSFVSASGCHTGFPAGFIRPGHYHDWITEVTGIDFDWVPEEATTTETPSTTEGDSEEGEETATTDAASTTEAATTTEVDATATTEGDSTATTEAATTTEVDATATTEGDSTATTEAATTTEVDATATTEGDGAETTEAATTTEVDATATTEGDSTATTEAATTTEVDATETDTTESETEAATEAATTEGTTTPGPWVILPEETETEAATEESSTESTTTPGPWVILPEETETEAATEESSTESTTTEGPWVILPRFWF